MFFYSCCLLRVAFSFLSFFLFAFSPLKRLRVAFSFLCVEKQSVLLIFILFFIAFNPLNRFRVAFS